MKPLLDPKTAVAFDEYEEEPEAPSAIPSLRRKFEKQNAPPPGAHNCYIGCPCIETAANAAQREGRLKYQAKLARRAARSGG